MWQRAVWVALLAAFVVRFGSDPHIAGGTESSVRLGQPGYDYRPVQAPAATGWALKALAFVLTRTPFGPLVRRHLLDDNSLSTLRELAAQAPELQALSTPLLRLSPAARAAHEAEAEEAAAAGLSAEAVLRSGLRVGDNGGGSRIEGYHAAYRSGSLDPVTAARRLLRAVRARQAAYMPFASVLESDVLAQARASAARWRSANGPISVLDGVPVAVKDMIDTRGHLTSDGSASNQGADARAAGDDPIVARLRELGAVVLGTTVMTEGGVTPLGYCAHYDGPFNPHNASHYPGGSSSGSAVAVALGLCPMAVGFDGGGSVRIPAAWSGAVGLATSYGRVDFTSLRASSMVKAGPIAATVADAAIAFAAMSKPAPEHVHAHFARAYDGGQAGGLPTAHVGGFGAAGDLRGVRLGLFRAHFDDASAAVLAACRQAVARLEAAGATVVPIEIPNIGWLRLAHAVKISTEFASAWDVKYAARAALEPNTRVTVGLGATVTAVEALACDKLRAWAFEHVAGVFAARNITAIVSPTLPIVAPAMPPGARGTGESNTGLVVEMMKFIFMANFLGMPAISVPVGADSGTGAAEGGTGGMPIGLQFLAPHWREHDLLRLARAAEQGAPPLPKPADYFDVLAPESESAEEEKQRSQA
eukprot:g4156.t1